MGEVVTFKRPRKPSIRGIARTCLSEALSGVDGPQAVVVIVLGKNGTYSFRSANYEAVSDFDLYSRAGALMDKEKINLIT